MTVDVQPGFNLDADEKPSVFLQWKGTDACLDFYCRCGSHCHFDGYFAYFVRCPHCETVWEMPSILYPREAPADTPKDRIEMAQTMQGDEDWEPA